MADRKASKFARIAIILAFALAVLSVAAFGLWQLSRSRTFQLFGEIIPRIETTEKVVALTFDDGPTPANAPRLLDILKAHGVHATFFVTGGETEKNPDLVRAMLAGGHDIGNHTWSHPRMTLAGEDEAAREIEPTDAQIRAVGYTGVINFRPPYGKKLWGLPLYLARHDRRTITWDVEPDSDDAIAKSATLIESHVLANVKPGSIVLLHAMYAANEPARQALPAIIDGLRARGYRFVTVTELLAMRAKP